MNDRANALIKLIYSHIDGADKSEEHRSQISSHPFNRRTSPLLCVKCQQTWPCDSHVNWKELFLDLAGKAANELYFTSLNSDMADSIIFEMGQILSQHDCAHGNGVHSLTDTPPMMYPEWLQCVLKAYSE